MSKATFPNVPPGSKITDSEASVAAKIVRHWYENDGERIETDQIVTVVRWALHALHAKQEGQPASDGTTIKPAKSTQGNWGQGPGRDGGPGGATP